MQLCRILSTLIVNLPEGRIDFSAGASSHSPKKYIITGTMKMSDEISLIVNGTAVTLPAGATVAVAMAIAGQPCRTSVIGEPRGPLCGMGICFECRVSINGKLHGRSCQILCEPGMDVRTSE